MIRTLFWLLLLGALIYVGATVNLGKRTLFGHIANIWDSEEARELRDDVDRTTAPMLERVRRAAEAGWHEYRGGEDEDAGTATAATAAIDAATVEAP